MIAQSTKRIVTMLVILLALLWGTAAHAAPSIPVYDDFLYTNVYLWGATIDTAETNTVYSGSRSLAVTFEGSYRGFTLQNDTPLDISQHEMVRLWAHGSAAGQIMQIQLIDGSNTDLNAIEVTIGAGWQLVEIPLSDYGSPATMLGMKIASGNSYPPTLYLDNIEVVDADETATATPNPNATATPLPTAEPALDGGFRIVDGRLIDANGNDFVMRGVNHAHTWYPQEVGAFADIAATGANAIRVVLSSGDLIENGNDWGRNDAADVADVIARCKDLQMICVLEVHDTVGYGDKPGAVDLATAVDYWLEIQSVLTGEEAYVIVNIGNEPYGNNNASEWTAETIAAIGRLRTAGFTHTLMVDAPNWGQDWQNIMRDNAQTVFDSDTLANTIFSVHMYEIYGTAAPIEAYMATFVSRGLPLVVGEFGDEHFGSDVDEDAILATAAQLGIGWLGWSWSGNSGGAENLDLANNYDAADLSAWGNRLINGTDGIAETSETASVFTTTTAPLAVLQNQSAAYVSSFVWLIIIVGILSLASLCQRWLRQ